MPGQPGPDDQDVHVLGRLLPPGRTAHRTPFNTSRDHEPGGAAGTPVPLRRRRPRKAPDGPLTAPPRHGTLNPGRISARQVVRVGGIDPRIADRRRLRRAAGGAAVVLPACVLLATSGVLGPYASQAVDDAAQLGGAVFASWCCWSTWRRDVPRRAHGPESGLWRLLLFVGITGWACGQAVWSWYQLVGDRPLPSPSLADVGLLHVAAVRRPGRPAPARRPRGRPGSPSQPGRCSGDAGPASC